MTDYAIVFKDDGYFDMQFDQGLADFVLDEGLETPVIISLFVDKRADPEQVIRAMGTGQEGETIDQRGYWGDVVVDVEGDETGSLLWLIERESLTDDVVTRAKNYILDSLQWMIEDSVASDVIVDTARIGNETLCADIQILRPQGDETYKYDILWQQQKLKRAVR